MMCIRCKSGKNGLSELVAKAEGLPCGCMLLSPSAVKGRTSLEMAFAFYLARRAIFEGRNISNKVSNEALLFLSCESNFSSALRRMGAKDARDFALVCEKIIPLARVKRVLGLSSAREIALPVWGKRKGNYAQAELAIERMALARVRN
jgi:tRNA threonylcarbamoyladenosine modification (KEOPS) complex Cgi121 subunit